MMPNRFIIKKHIDVALADLSSELSQKFNSNLASLSKRTRNALRKWEKSTKIKSSKLYQNGPNKISAFIPHILTFFKEELENIFKNPQDLNQALEITNIALYRMFSLEKYLDQEL